MSLTLVIVHWNARDHLERCLRAASTTGYPIVVVDNASGDGGADLVRAAWPQVTLVASERNLGFAGGVNAGVARTTTPWVLLLNPDIVVTPEAVDLLLQASVRDEGIGAAGARLMNPDGSPQQGFSIRRFPTLATWAADLLLVDHVWPGNPATRRYEARDLDPSRDQDVDQPAAACLLVRRAAFDAVGGFDEGFHPAWFEDVDFCRRLWAFGWRIRYVADARIVHEGGVAMRTLGLAPFASIWHRNMLRYAARHAAWPARLLLRPLIIIGMVLRALIGLARGKIADARAYLRVIPIALK